MGWVKEALARLEVRASKSRGQNFLQSSHEAERLVKQIGIKSSDTVLEIGPGLGALTGHLLDSALNVYCIEIEESFIGYLDKRFVDQEKKPKFILSDFRDVQLVELKFDPISELKIVSNLPYVFSTDAILWLIKNRTFFKKCSLLVQKEFAERIAAVPNTKAIGSISIHAQFFFDIELGIEIQGGAFYPSTEVSSRQIHLLPKKTLPNLSSPISFFEKTVRASFAMRRKKLANCIAQAFPSLGKAQIEDLLIAIGLSPLIRAENLTVENFCSLSDKLFDLDKAVGD